MSEVSQSLRFQWLVSAHRAFRHAGREVINCTAYMDAIGQHSFADKLSAVPGLDADRTNCTAYMDANGQHSLADKLRAVPDR
jgi:hypothetical protein